MGREQTARNLLTYILSKDLAYEYSLLLSPSLLNYAIISFVIFNDPVYDTNADIDVQPGYVELSSWSPISKRYLMQDWL